MREALLEYLRCPACRGRLEPNPFEQEDEVRIGELLCESCGRRFPICEGLISAMDLSPAMLRVAQEKLTRCKIQADLAVGNAAYFPYKSETFADVLHFGGINTFRDKQRSLEEILRVAKPGAGIVICDEGLAPGKGGSSTAPST